MKVKMNIKTKMLVYILTTTIIIFAAAVGYISYSSRKMAFNDATRYTNKVASEYAARIQQELSNDMSTIRALAEAFEVYKTMPNEQWKPIFIDMYQYVFANNPHFYKLWDSWEFTMIDPTWTKAFGRYCVTYYREGGSVKYSTTTRSLNGDPSLYGRVKAEQREFVWEPYFDNAVEQGQQRKFMTTLSVPIKNQGKYVGIVAVDIIMEKFQQIINEIRPFEGSYAFLVSNQGIFVGHPNAELIGKTLKEYMPEINAQYAIDQRIMKGEAFSMEVKDPLHNNEAYLSFSPIFIGKSTTPWAIALSVPVDVVTLEARTNYYISLIVGLLGLLFLTLVIFVISANISKPLNETTHLLRKLAQGDISDVEDLDIKTGDEIEDMAVSVNTLIDGLNKTADFATHIGKGNLDADFTILSEQDVLGNSLLEMRKSLKHAEEEERKRKIEDEKQNWTTLGIAKFGEILRQNNDNLKDLGFSVMSNLINYLDASQGALFVLNEKSDGELVYELVSAIAYGRSRLMKKEIRVGEDLVGRCAHEKLTIYLTEVPEDYVQITSGMGTANPTCILIVPVMLNESVFGVIEMASFKEFEPYQIEFVEKIGQSIASTISSVKINEKTARLLSQSQMQKEELAAQEEEMRQNLEELQATQEESARREFETRGLIHALSASTLTVEYDMTGRITDINAPFAELMGATKEQIVGLHHKDGLEVGSEKEREADLLWADLRAGLTRKVVSKISYNNRELWLSETYTPLLDVEDVPYKVLKIGFDITNVKKQAQELENKALELERLKHELDHQKHEMSTDDITKYQEEIDRLKSENEKQIRELSKKTNQVSNQASRGAGLRSDQGLIVWSERFITGIAELDEQRERIAAMANSLYVGLLAEKSKKEIKEMLKELIDYAGYHFGTEERYFKEFLFSGTKPHIHEHGLFLSELTRFQEDFSSGKLRFLDSFINFMEGWFDKHFGVSDKDYADLFKSKGL